MWHRSIPKTATVAAAVLMLVVTGFAFGKSDGADRTPTVPGAGSVSDARPAASNEGAGTAAPDKPDADVAAPTLTHVFNACVQLGKSLHIGYVPNNDPGFTPITGGTVSGPRLDGTVLPYGGDWWTDYPTFTTLNAHYLLRTNDGAVIDVHDPGYWRPVNAGAAAKYRAGKALSESEVYYRGYPTFKTGSPKYAWMNSTVFVAMLRAPDPSTVWIRFYALE